MGYGSKGVGHVRIKFPFLLYLNRSQPSEMCCILLFPLQIQEKTVIEASCSNGHKLTIHDTTWGNPDPHNTTGDITQQVQAMSGSVFPAHEATSRYLDSYNAPVAPKRAHNITGDIVQVKSVRIKMLRRKWRERESMNSQWCIQKNHGE